MRMKFYVLFFLSVFCYQQEEYTQTRNQLMQSISGVVITDEQNCPILQCDSRTIGCPYRSFYADIPSRKICRACNVCIKPGSPVDSKGCPQLPCPKTVPSGACMHPWFYNSWVVYNGIQCQTCESLLCNA